MAAPYVEPFLSWQFAPYLLPYFPQKYEKNEWDRKKSVDVYSNSAWIQVKL